MCCRTFVFKKKAIEYDNWAGHRRQKIEEVALSKNYSEMGKGAGKRKKGYVDFLRDQSYLNYLINHPGSSSYEFRIMDGFGTKHAKGSLLRSGGRILHLLKT